MASSDFCWFFLLALSSLSMANAASSSLQAGFYSSTCPAAEDIVRDIVNRTVTLNPGLGAGLIRLHFHDCFVRGCDASVLIDSTPTSPAEKDNPANNPSLRGFEVIDEAKAGLEAVCPETVSCADILAFAARDSVFKLGGFDYTVEAGRRDGRISNISEPFQNLPPPFFNAQQLQQIFESKGLSWEEMVVLSGAHSIGISHCSSFSKRLYSFNATTPQDPSLDPGFATDLKAKCPNVNSSDPTVAFDVVSPDTLDNKYYQNVLNNKVVLSSDQTLSTDDPKTAGLVRMFGRHGAMWAGEFVKAMLHMGSIEVLTGDQGEIRKNCRIVN